MKYRVFFPPFNLIHGVHNMMPSFMDMTPTSAGMGTYQLVYEGDVHPGPGAEIKSTLNVLWQRHNEGDNLDGNRPRALEIRSMCVGDIIELLGTYYVVESVGFRELNGGEIPELNCDLFVDHRARR